ncbi:mandelate racemase/muconate lactonizing enzyme family protein [Pseudactinotalea suaedae]|uniref:mandelate racemase/muconate lactonizing enzyme family protein n=1 Tax=Pseudactinotalea suaedae TaxID=1524924 RepID=UPI0012E10231|nr:mandelate racemase/muconate lactonizing enzyme family protein [Pseudactinotalea suaedae]
MRITGVVTIPLVGHTPASGWVHETDLDTNIQTIVVVTDDEGRLGYGGVYTSQALVEAALDLVRPWLLGRDVDSPEHTTDHLDTMLFWQGRGGAVGHALSGLDIALWDLWGKIQGVSVSTLLGGRYRERVRPYASLLFDPPEQLEQRLEAVLALGYRAMKIGWKPFGRLDHATDEELVRTARRVVGPDIELMIDAGASEQAWPHGRAWAIRTARMLADHDIAWFEEALPPDDVEGYRLLREASPVPIATGEVLVGRRAFAALLDRSAVDIIQPDTTKCGGLSEARKIGWMAEDAGVQMVSHGWNNAVGLTADLHLASARPLGTLVEYVTPSAYIDGLLASPPALDHDGMLAVPDGPGLGVELDPEALAFYAAASPYPGLVTR